MGQAQRCRLTRVQPPVTGRVLDRETELQSQLGLPDAALSGQLRDPSYGKAASQQSVQHGAAQAQPELGIVRRQNCERKRTARSASVPSVTLSGQGWMLPGCGRRARQSRAAAVWSRRTSEAEREVSLCRSGPDMHSASLTDWTPAGGEAAEQRANWEQFHACSIVSGRAMINRQLIDFQIHDFSFSLVNGLPISVDLHESRRIIFLSKQNTCFYFGKQSSTFWPIFGRMLRTKPAIQRFIGSNFHGGGNLM